MTQLTLKSSQVTMIIDLILEKRKQLRNQGVADVELNNLEIDIIRQAYAV